MAKSGEMFAPEDKLVGAHVPKELADHIGLIAVYSNTSRSSLLLELILERIKEEEDIPTMIAVIAKRAFDEWSENLQADLKFGKYIGHVEVSLAKKKLSREHVDAIVAKVEEFHEEGEEQP